MNRIVWMSVASILFVAAAVVAAFAGNSDVILASGLSAVATAVLATREK
jgi:hypothetical protein